MRSTLSFPALQQSRWFFAAICLYWAVGLAWLVIYGKADGFLIMRPKGNAIIDFFFAGITHMGDGWAAVLLTLVFIFRKKFGTAFVIFSGYAVSGLISQAMKHSLQMPRPAPYFQSLGKAIHTTVGVELLQSNTSFPSGHSATAFALATALVLMNAWWRKKMVAGIVVSRIGRV